MPYISPNMSDVHVQRPLGTISVAFWQKAEAFGADKMFPNVPTPKQSDYYIEYGRGDLNRDEMQKRALATKSARASYSVSKTLFNCEWWSLGRDIPDPLRQNADAPINLDREATELLTQQALIKREVEWVSNFFTTGKWTTDATLGTKWDVGGSDPVGDVRTGKRTVLQSTGYMPNKVAVTRAVYDTLIDHADIIGRLDRGQTPGGPALTNRQQLAAIFEVEEIVVLDAIKNTAAEGATDVHAFIAGADGFLLTSSPNNPGIMVPSAGYTFSWTDMFGNAPTGTRIRKFRDEPILSDTVEIDMWFDQKLIAADLGYFIADCIG